MTRPVSMDRIRSFLAVAAAGGFTAASTQTGISKDVLSKDVARLERELGVALFVRNTRHVQLSEDGVQLQAMVAPLFRSIDDAMSAIGRRGLFGQLRVTVPADYFVSVLAPAVAAFGLAHPELEFELITDNHVIDLVANRIDVAVRLGGLEDSGLVATKLSNFRLIPVASAGYLERVSAPAHPSDLASHSFIALSAITRPTSFRFRHVSGSEYGLHLDARFKANDVNSMIALACAGAGVTIVPDFAVASRVCSRELQVLLDGWSLASADIHLVRPYTHQVPPKVRAFVAHLKASFDAPRD